MLEDTPSNLQLESVSKHLDSRFRGGREIEWCRPFQQDSSDQMHTNAVAPSDLFAGKPSLLCTECTGL